MNPAIDLINIYQRWISPYNGFFCSHRVHHGGDSCSEAAKRIINERGPFAGLRDIRRRLRGCGQAAEAIRLAQGEDARIGDGQGFFAAESRRKRSCRAEDLPLAPCDYTPGCDVGGCDF